MVADSWSQNDLLDLKRLKSPFNESFSEPFIESFNKIFINRFNKKEVKMDRVILRFKTKFMQF